MDKFSNAVSNVSKSVIDRIYEEIKTPYEYALILRPSAISGNYDSNLVDNPNVFCIPGEDEYVYMTFVGHDGEGYRTGLARSKDFISWEKLGLILDNGINSVGTGRWDSYNAGGYIVRDHVWGEIPTPHVNSDGKFCMTYLASDQAGYEAGIKKAGIAFSDSVFNADGSLTQWVRYENPVLSGDAGYAYEKNTIWKMQAIYNAEENLYYGFYNAAKDPEIMCGVTSPDLLHWTRMENNPLLTVDTAPDGGVWGASHNADADVVKIGDYWVMHYFTSTPSNGIVDSFAVSSDLVHWTKSYIPTVERNSTWSSVYAHKPCVIKHNGVVYHYYNAVGSEGRSIAVNTSVDLSVLKQAQDLVSVGDGKQMAVLKAINELQMELRKPGGSVAEIVAARDSLAVLLNV